MTAPGRDGGQARPRVGRGGAGRRIPGRAPPDHPWYPSGVRCFLSLLLLSVLPVFRLSLAAADWRPLFDGRSLAGWKSTEFAGRGEVEVTDGVLVLNQGQLTGITLTQPVIQGEFEVELEARKTLGNDFFCGLTFPVGTNHATLIVGGWGGAVVGISSLDGNDASQNPTTQYRRFQSERWYKIRLRVLKNRLAAWIDDESVVDVDLTGRRVSMRPGEIELSRPFGIAAWNTTAELRNLRWRPVEPAAAPAPKGATNPPPPGRPAAFLPGDQIEAGLPAGVEPVVLPARYGDIADQLVAAGTGHDFAWRRLAEMCDRFGPRFSGSTNLESALDWILGQMRADGLEQVRGEPVTVTRWVRGNESVEVTAPWAERLPMLGLGGSVGTPPEGITAPVLVVTNFAELSARAGEARGKIVLFNPPFTRYGETVRYRAQGAAEAARAGAVAALIRSVADFGLRTPHTGAMGYPGGVERIPIAALAAEDAARLQRWQERGVTPVVRLRMEARTAGEAVSRNVLAEVRGREHPEEILVVGGHIDSWDVGRGALDDGGGCVAAWEALRLIRQCRLQPRRTIRCVLWTNEENGLAGANAYREAHAAELDRHVLAIESDNGALGPRGLGFTGTDRGLALMLAVGGLLEPRLGAGRIFKGGADADTGPLLAAGVPVAGLRVEGERYFWFHHTEADTPERVDPGVLARCATLLAVTLFTVAEVETRLPR